ncbi:MAG: FecR family protein, partial [Hyphomonas sp.]|uniref:FecR family protein n=1 Tax=Hyphomonas sp. TaxID=87 RepID=UPI0030012001
MLRFISVAVLAVFSTASLTIASADTTDWHILESGGIVRVMIPGSAIVKGQPGMELPTGTLITTGQGGEATLVRGEQRVSMASDSRLTLSANSEDLTRIRQDSGTVLYEVDRKKVPHFRVDTALLAAVVKGTGFTVSAGPDTDIVHVSHGLVQVLSQADGGAADVSPGETALIAQSAPSQITIKGPKDAAILPGMVDVPPIDYAGASGNLVQGADIKMAPVTANGNGYNGEAQTRGASEAGGNNSASSMGSSALLARQAGANSNAGGNGNGNAGGNGNGNAGSNGNGNAGGNGNGNAGGNGNGNAGGNDNGNAGGNGNGNAGGNGNG